MRKVASYPNTTFHEEGVARRHPPGASEDRGLMWAKRGGNMRKEIVLTAIAAALFSALVLAQTAGGG